MQLTVVLSLILVELMGLLFLFFLKEKKLNLFEWIGLAFPLGLFQLCFSVIFLDMLGALPWNPWLWIMEVLLCAVWGIAGFKKHRNELSKTFSFQIFPLKPITINALFLVVLVFVLYIGWMNFYNTLYYPTYDPDGIWAFDVVGYIMSKEHTLRHLSIFQAPENPFIHNPGSCIGYTPLLQISYAYVYWAGAQTSKSIVALLFVSMMLVVYGASRRSMGKTASILLVFAIMSTPKILEYSSWSLTNVMLLVFSIMAVIYALLWINSGVDDEDKSFFKKISCILFAASIMVRIEGFVVPAITGLILLWIVFAKRRMKFREVLLWGCGVLLPFILWTFYQKAVGLSTESFFIARPFWDYWKAYQIGATFKGVFIKRLYYGFVFLYAVLACVVSLFFVYKRKDNLYGFFILFGSMFLYGLTLYHVDYVWDTIDRVLADSAMRFILLYVPIAWYCIFTCYPVSWFLNKMEHVLSFEIGGQKKQ
ncbi:MAG: hypothetical protein K2J57_02730 [Bacteroidales bacterium]|nr:hypothetical protein [Bacteroidales bacterium]